MKKLKSLILILLSVFLFNACIVNETEKISKKEKMRIELSNCYNCRGCVTDFKCPRDAIKSNKLENGFEIDVSECINCGLCKSEFKCPGNAFTQEADIIKPGVVKNFKISEKTENSVSVVWDGTGDDKISGTPYKYVVMISESEIGEEDSNLIEQKKEISGFDEKSCKFEDLITGKTYYISIKAADEAGNGSVITFIKILI